MAEKHSFLTLLYETVIKYFMPKLIPSTKLKIVPKDGEIEITLNINISVDGGVTASSSQAKVSVVEEKSEDDSAELMVPDFFAEPTITFGKKG